MSERSAAVSVVAYMMRQVWVHDYDVVAGRVLQSVQISGSQTQLLLPRTQYDLFGPVYVLQLFGYFLGAIGTVIVDDYDLVIVTTLEKPI